MKSELVHELRGGEVTAFLPEIYDTSSDFVEISTSAIKVFAKSKGYELCTVRINAVYDVDMPKDGKKPIRVSSISDASLKIHKIDKEYMAVLDIVSSSRLVY